jgi:hypothetical protein
LTTYSDIGNSATTSYQLWWDESTDVLDIIALESLDLTHLLIGLNPLLDFKFQIRAKNIYGYGDKSDVHIIRTSDVPDTQVTVLTLTVVLQKTFVISWEMPHNSGEVIDEYQMQLLDLTDFWVEDPNCFGLTTSCIFTHEYLMQTYGYQVGHVVQAKVRAHNLIGWGAYSQPNTGAAYVMSVPSKM